MEQCLCLSGAARAMFTPECKSYLPPCHTAAAECWCPLELAAAAQPLQAVAAKRQPQVARATVGVATGADCT